MMRFPFRFSLLMAVAVGLCGGVSSAWAQGGGLSSADTVRVTLTEAIVRSLEESPEVDQRRAQRQHAMARSEQAQASRFLTDLSANTAHSFAPGLNIPAENNRADDELYLNPDVTNDWSMGALRPFSRAEIVAQQPLFTWGELSGNIRAARHGVAVEDAQVERKALEVAARTGELYYNLLLTKALDRLADRTREVIDRAKREIDRLLQEGDESVDEADMFQTRLTEEEYRRRVVEIDQNQSTVRSGLRRQMFLPEGTMVVPAVDEIQPVPFSVHPDSLEYYIQKALDNRPEVEQAEAGLAARRAQVDVAKSEYYPKIGIQASFGYSFSFPERPHQENAFVGDSYRGVDTRSGIGIQQNLNFAQTEARVEQAQAQLDEVRHQQRAAGQLVRFEVEEAYRNLLVAETNMESRERATTTTGDWLRSEQINFDLGFGDTENLVKAVRADLEARARYAESVKNYNLAVLRLLRATGTLVDRARDGTLLDESTTSGN